MPNYDGRHELRIFYDTTPSGENPMSHVLTIDFAAAEPFVAPGTPFASIPCTARIGSLTDLETATILLQGFIEGFFSDTTNFLRGEYWRYDAEPSQNATYISTFLMGSTGDTITGAVAAAQNTMTLRTQAGGIMRVQMMETSIMNNVKDPYPFSSTPATNLADYLVSDATIWVGRDNTYPIAPNYFSQTQNEKLYRKRYR